MICPRCGAKVADHKKFCGDCGSALPWRCSACGSENPADKRFCSDCGAAAFRAKPEGPPAPAAPQPSAELRQLTVMFVDLVGSTALGARLDPEDLRDVMAAYDGSVTGLVARFDGFVARYMGDGVLAYFGFPRAHEDDAERAIRTGLASLTPSPSLPPLPAQRARSAPAWPSPAGSSWWAISLAPRRSEIRPILRPACRRRPKLERLSSPAQRDALRETYSNIASLHCPM